MLYSEIWSVSKRKIGEKITSEDRPQRTNANAANRASDEDVWEVLCKTLEGGPDYEYYCNEVGQPECGSKRLKGNKWLGGRWGVYGNGDDKVMGQGGNE